MAFLLSVREADGRSVPVEEDDDANKEESEDNTNDYAGPDVGIFSTIIGELAS